MRSHLYAIVASSLVAAAQLGAPVLAQGSVQYDLNIQRQSLSQALQQFADQSGVQIIFFSRLTDGYQAPSLTGRFTAQTALAALLKDSPLTFRAVNANTIEIQSRDGQSTDGKSGYENTGATAGASATLQLVQAAGDASSGSGTAAAAELAGIESVVVTGSALWLGRTGETLKEVPQSVSVLDRERIQDQNLESLGDALEATTGITLQRASSLFANFYSRGFNITNLQLDGGASLDRSLGYGNVLPDMAQFERVEVLRGADGLFSGAGEPGGRVNMVRKRPTSTPQVQASVSTGRWHTHQAQLDIGGPLAFDGKLRGRMVTSYTDQGYFFDGARDGRKTLVYGIIDADLTSSTRLTIGGSYDDQSLPYFAYGLPRYASGQDLHLPRDTYLTPAWSYYDTRIKSGFAGLEQSLGAGWSLKLDLHYLKQDEERAGVNYYVAVDRQTGLGPAQVPSRQFGAVSQKSADLVVTGPFDLFGREHTLVIGGNWQQAGISSLNQSADTGAYAMGNVYDYDPRSFARPAAYLAPSSSYVPEITQSGIYAMVRFHVFDPLRVMIGGRYSKYRFESDFTDLVYDEVSSTLYEDNGVFTPYGGIVYELNQDWSLYTSIGETYSSQASSLRGPYPGTPLNPITGRNYEVGVKGNTPDKAVNFTAALYRIERKGEAVLDLTYDPVFGELGRSCCYLDDGEVVSQGVDVEVTSELFHGLTMTAGYTYNDNEDKFAGTGRAHSRTPRHLFKAFGTYRVPHTGDKLRVGGGVTAQTDNYASGSALVYDSNGNPTGTYVPYEFRQGGYAIWSLFADYRINPRFSAALNVSNLFDKTYYSTIGVSGYGNWYGEPRNVTLTLRAHF